MDKIKIEKMTNIKNLKQIKRSYKTDFPPIERMPYWYLKRLAKKGILEILFFKQQEEICGYMITVQNQNSYVIIEYFAIFKKYRSKGYGSECLKLCKDYYSNTKGILIEAEQRGLGKDEKDNLNRERRIKFYEKNGYKSTNVLITIWGVIYEVLINNEGNVIEQENIIQIEKKKCEKILGKKLLEEKCKFEIED